MKHSGHQDAPTPNTSEQAINLRRGNICDRFHDYRARRRQHWVKTVQQAAFIRVPDNSNGDAR